MTSARTAIQQVQNVIASSVPYAALFTAPMREAYRLDRVHYPYTNAFGGLAGQNGLTAVATAVISDIVQPGTRTTLRYAEADGGYIEVDIGPGSVAWPVPILLTTRTAPGYPLPSGQKFTNFAFDLEVPYDYPRLYMPYMALETTPSNNVRQPQSPQATNASTFFFFKPITVTVHYLDNDVSNVDENTLQLLYWNQQAWQDAATTCGDSGPGYSNNTQANLIQVGICHFTRFATSGN
jgi:hypothetical protein